MKTNNIITDKTPIKFSRSQKEAMKIAEAQYAESLEQFYVDADGKLFHPSVKTLKERNLISILHPDIKFDFTDEEFDELSEFAETHDINCDIRKAIKAKISFYRSPDRYDVVRPVIPKRITGKNKAMTMKAVSSAPELDFF